MDRVFTIVIAAVIVAAVVAQAYVTFYFGKLWFQARMSGVHVSLVEIIGIKFRKVNPAVVVRSLIMAKLAGMDLPSADVERAYLEGVDVEKVVRELIAAKRSNQLQDQTPEIIFRQLVDAELKRWPVQEDRP